MLRGLWKLTWVELKIFLREPMGAFFALGFPVVLFLIFGRVYGNETGVMTRSIPIFAVIGIATSGILSLVIIISIYREGGILKRLKTTPLSPITILTAHFLVKFILIAMGMTTIFLLGGAMYNIPFTDNLFSFVLAFILCTVSLVSLGYVIASIVPTARFAQPIASAVVYTMIFYSGIFFDVGKLSSSLTYVAQVMPLTHAANLLSGVWEGDNWSNYTMETIFLLLTTVVCLAISSKIFRWE